jgi:hypothetical protein
MTKQRNQIVLANVCILAGIAFQYFRGFPLLHLAITGILILAVVNLIFFVRAQKMKKLQ